MLPTLNASVHDFLLSPDIVAAAKDAQRPRRRAKSRPLFPQTQETDSDKHLKRYGARRLQRYFNDTLADHPICGRQCRPLELQPEDLTIGYARWTVDPLFTHPMFLRFNHLSERAQDRLMSSITHDDTLRASDDSKDGSNSNVNVRVSRNKLNLKHRYQLKYSNLPLHLVERLENILLLFITDQANDGDYSEVDSNGTDGNNQASQRSNADTIVQQLASIGITAQIHQNLLILHTDDQFVRMLMHCLANYHECQSSSCDGDDGHRMIYIRYVNHGSQQRQKVNLHDDMLLKRFSHLASSRR